MTSKLVSSWTTQTQQCFSLYSQDKAKLEENSYRIGNTEHKNRAFYHIHILRPWERKCRFYGIFFTHTIFENILAAIHQIKQDKIHKALGEIVTNRQKSRYRTRATKGGKCVFNSFLIFFNAKNENNFKKEIRNRDLFTGSDLDSSCERIKI